MTNPPDYCLQDAAGNKWSGHRMPKQLCAIIAAYMNNHDGPKWAVATCKEPREKRPAILDNPDIVWDGGVRPSKKDMRRVVERSRVVVAKIVPAGMAGPWQDENAGLKGFD